ncbi:hypothetical protein ACTFIU_003528 [Dictyostelium citrinum]
MNNPIINNVLKPLSQSFDELFVDKDTEDSFLCPICIKLIIDARQGCTEGHVFCNNCITSWLKKNNTCPVCRLFISPNNLSKNRYIDSCIKKIKVHCPNKNDLNNLNYVNGCTEIVEIGNVESHSLKCLYRYVLCQFGGDKCGPVRLNKLLSHEIQCPFVEEFYKHAKSLDIV